MEWGTCGCVSCTSPLLLTCFVPMCSSRPVSLACPFACLQDDILDAVCCTSFLLLTHLCPRAARVAVCSQDDFLDAEPPSGAGTAQPSEVVVH
jgi:hypothetical protein